MSRSIGEVVQTDTRTVEWKIPGSRRLPRRMDPYVSPHFIVSNTEWYLILKLYTGKMYLSLRSHCSLKTKDIIKCIIKWPNGSEETAAYMHNSKVFSIESFELYVFDGSAEDCQIDDLHSRDTLTVVCHFELEEQSDSHDRKLKSRETQTEVLHSETDSRNDEKHDDSTSSEADGVTTLIKNMKELLTDGNDDYDVRIFVADKEFRAHSNILKARSPVFKMMLTHDTKEKFSGDITIEDCDPDSFDEFLLFVYSGKTENLTPSKAVHLYYTADKYDFAELKEQCVCCMKTSLSTSSVCDVVLLAAKYGEHELLEKATEFFTQNIKEVLFTVEWQKFMSKHPTEANELYIKSLVLFNKS